MVKIESYVDFYLNSFKIIQNTKDPLISNIINLEFYISQLLKEYFLILIRIDNRQVIYNSGKGDMEKIQSNSNLITDSYLTMDSNYLKYPIRDDTYKNFKFIQCSFTHRKDQYAICIYLKLKSLQVDVIPFLKMYLLLYSSCWQSSINHLATPKNPEMYISYLEQLSERQKIILNYVKKNLSNTDISCKLNFSVSTIRNEIGAIFKTLQVKNHKELIYIINQFSK